MAIPPGTYVRLITDPSQRGTTTAITMDKGPIRYVLVNFGSYKEYRKEDLLEAIVETKNPHELFMEGAFGPPSSLRLAVILEKLRGQITNIFYSMNVSSAQFLPYQFKPVLKFIESISGRMLIADEVGLGKTIEAAYIWKELQARKDAKRLLILCPAVLREKWKHDLGKLFGINANILDADGLLELLKNVWLAPEEPFMVIISIEAIRSKYDPDGDEAPRSNQDKIVHLMHEQMTRQPDFNLFDLVIIDEAHYLRNQNTASNKTATIIRDNTDHLVLLSATPVQTSSLNLFQLLKLLSPEDYYDYNAFLAAVEENRPILDAIAAISKKDTTVHDIRFHHKKLKGLIDENLRESFLAAYLEADPKPQERIDLSWRLSEYSYLNEYMNRTRKRDVQERRVVRDAHTVSYGFTSFERGIYESISYEIRQQIQQSVKGSPFVLTLRQRHMASCLPMGVQAYKRSLSEQVDDYESEYFDEELMDEEKQEPPTTKIAITEDLIDSLKKIDSKYGRISRSLREEVFAENPNEKIIIFSFFRSTVMYLEKRLREDGFSTCLIRGGMDGRKFEILEQFAQDDGPNILLSTEVGAEGLDLQFAKVILNYDLPWNPMRVEQRIGRIDRIGQKAEKISIFNMVCQDTVEDKILDRLYQRINIFEGTIGQLDEILGNRVEQLILKVINEGLSLEQAEEQADATALAIETNRRDEEELEQQAMNLLGFNDFIMQSIHDAKDRDRFVSPSDLTSFVDDFFSSRFLGTKVRERYENREFIRVITLTEVARESLSAYIRQHPSTIQTRLSSQSTPTICSFDPTFDRRQVKTKYVEIIELKHPLIQWMLAEHEKDPEAIHRCSAVTVPTGFCKVPSGHYVFIIQRWTSSGSIERKELKYFARRIGSDPGLFNEGEQERLIREALRYGTGWVDHTIGVDLASARDCFEGLKEEISLYGIDYMENLRIDHEIRLQKQKRYAESIWDRKAKSINSRLEGLRANNRSQGVINMELGKLKQNDETYRRQLRRIEGKVFDPRFAEVAVGIIQVEES